MTACAPMEPQTFSADKTGAAKAEEGWYQITQTTAWCPELLRRNQ